MSQSPVDGLTASLVQKLGWLGARGDGGWELLWRGRRLGVGGLESVDGDGVRCSAYVQLEKLVAAAEYTEGAVVWRVQRAAVGVVADIDMSAVGQGRRHVHRTGTRRSRRRRSEVAGEVAQPHQVVSRIRSGVALWRGEEVARQAERTAVHELCSAALQVGLQSCADAEEDEADVLGPAMRLVVSA